MQAGVAPVMGKVADAAVMGKDQPVTITTTLYDLVAAIRASVAPDEEGLVVATVVHLLRSGRSRLLGREAYRIVVL